MPAIAIYLRSDDLGRRNLEHAIQSSRWGFTHDRGHYLQVAPGTTVLIGTGFRHPMLGGSPRRSSALWSEGLLRRIAVFRAESGIRSESTLLRPDELENEELRYPFRLDVKHLRDVHDVPTLTLPSDLVEAFRVSAASGGSGILVPSALPDTLSAG